MVSWNTVNPRTIRDLSNFWCIYYSLKYEITKVLYKDYFATVAEAINYIMNDVYNEPKTTKEKYLEYRENIKRKGK